MNSSFDSLGISSPILKAISDMGFEVPTEVQLKAIPPILNGKDVIVMSKTGSGKTAVFGVPMLQMTDPSAPGPQGLILTPTRELAVQVDSDLKKLAKHLRHRTTAVYGQHNMSVEIQTLNKGVSIVTGTPGRVFDHISHRNLDTRHISFLVLDEADRMLDMGFLDQVVRIIQTLPKNRLTLLCSATIPYEVQKICREYMKNPVMIEIESQTKTVETTLQEYYRINGREKDAMLNRLLLYEQPESCMIFCNTKIAVDRVQKFLSRKGYACLALHGDIPQTRRSKTIQQFKQGEFNLLVATDVAARGLHIEDLALVINYDVPLEKDGYVHRIGRTGRAGKGDRAITLVTGNDIMSLYEIEEHIGAMIPEAELPSESFFAENKASVDQWIRTNSQAGRPSAVVSEMIASEPQKRAPSPNPSQPKRKQPERPIKAVQETKPSKPSQKSHDPYPMEQGKPVHIIIKPADPRPADSAPAQAKPSTDNEPVLDPGNRTPLIKRLLQRIIGRQDQ